MAAVLLGSVACRAPRSAEAPTEPERLARTEFTQRIENFFEYDPLIAGKASSFLIHLTDLNDGAPVENAEVTLAVRGAGGAMGPAKARVGKVTGIYVAEVTVPTAGQYSIDFHVKSSRLDERMALDGFVAR